MLFRSKRLYVSQSRYVTPTTTVSLTPGLTPTVTPTITLTQTVGNIKPFISNVSKVANLPGGNDLYGTYQINVVVNDPDCTGTHIFIGDYPPGEYWNYYTTVPPESGACTNTINFDYNPIGGIKFIVVSNFRIGYGGCQHDLALTSDPVCV